MPYTGTIDGPYQMRKYLGVSNTADIQQGDTVPTALEINNVIAGSGATVTLTAAQSNSLCLFDRAAGIVYTLPAPAVGLKFRFFVATTITSNSAKVITNAGTVFLLGTISYSVVDATPGATGGPKFTSANGTTHVAITQNGTTTGGIAGTYFECSCISSTVWMLTGLVVASSTIATPFATS